MEALRECGERTFPMRWGYTIPGEWKSLERFYNGVIEMTRRYSGWQIF
jgi:hypothetical protein